jgi:hypothetical protein
MLINIGPEKHAKQIKRKPIEGRQLLDTWIESLVEAAILGVVSRTTLPACPSLIMISPALSDQTDFIELTIPLVAPSD